MKKIVFLLSIFVLLSSCSNKTLDIKSPCVSNEDGPCGPKRPVNDWWMKKTQNS